jgi:hypothetical protein
MTERLAVDNKINNNIPTIKDGQQLKRIASANPSPRTAEVQVSTQ